jgi:hypothetical protein
LHENVVWIFFGNIPDITHETSDIKSISNSTLLSYSTIENLSFSNLNYANVALRRMKEIQPKILNFIDVDANAFFPCNRQHLHTHVQ